MHGYIASRLVVWLDGSGNPSCLLEKYSWSNRTVLGHPVPTESASLALVFGPLVTAALFVTTVWGKNCAEPIHSRGVTARTFLPFVTAPLRLAGLALDFVSRMLCTLVFAFWSLRPWEFG